MNLIEYIYRVNGSNEGHYVERAMADVDVEHRVWTAVSRVFDRVEDAENEKTRLMWPEIDHDAPPAGGVLPGRRRRVR